MVFFRINKIHFFLFLTKSFIFQGGEYPPFPNEIAAAGYGGLWDPHHCLSGGQNAPTIGPYPADILSAAFNSDLVWPRQQCGALVPGGRLGRSGGALNHQNGGVLGVSNGAHSSHHQKKTRRRVATIAQRRAANIRERRRMFNLNEAFDKLRRKVSSYFRKEL